MNINIYRKNGILNINSGGRRGAQGEAGKGVPAGGTTGQVLSKKTDTDFDTEWRDDGLSQKVNKTGDTMTGNLVMSSAYVDVNGARVISSTGFPNGVVSAPVGSKYIDKNATSGAIEWVKTSGTGNTGWVVSVGDTGWISLPINSVWKSGIFRVRRVNETLYAQAISMVAGPTISGIRASVQSLLDSSMPAGFRRTTNWGLGGSGLTSGIRVGQIPSIILNTTGPSTFAVRAADGTTAAGQAWQEGDTVNGDMSYYCDDAWPTTLPGTPA